MQQVIYLTRAVINNCAILHQANPKWGKNYTASCMSVWRTLYRCNNAEWRSIGLPVCERENPTVLFLRKGRFHFFNNSPAGFHEGTPRRLLGIGVTTTPSFVSTRWNMWLDILIGMDCRIECVPNFSAIQFAVIETSDTVRCENENLAKADQAQNYKCFKFAHCVWPENKCLSSPGKLQEFRRRISFPGFLAV